MKRTRTHFQSSNAPIGMHAVPQKWACLRCRVVIKMPRDFEPAAPLACPRCRNRIFFAGKSFRAPKQSDEKAWRKVALMLRAGYVFHPDHLGRVPGNPNALEDWERLNRDKAQQFRGSVRQSMNERRWEQLRRAAAWHANEKRRRREERAEER